jgi:uncharacterized membrane protein YdjX (TVP38/TMEM64 family)
MRRREQNGVAALENRLAWRTLLLLGLCLIAAVLVSSSALHPSLMRILNASEAVIRQYSALGPLTFVGFAAISAMFAFFSTAMLVPIAVLTWGSVSTIVMLWIGWTAGGLASYVLARYFGRRVLTRCGAGTLLDRFEHWVRPDAPFGLVLILQLALPSEIPGYLLGLVRYSPRKYFCALALAELPYALATVYLGQGLIERRSGLILAVGVVVSAMSLTAAHLLRTKLRNIPSNRIRDASSDNVSCF